MITLSHTLCVFTFVALSAIHVECQNEEFYKFILAESPKWYKFGPIANIRTVVEPTKSSEEIGSSEEETTPNTTMVPVEPTETTAEIPMCSQEMEQGNGTKIMYRYFYNATTNECVEFEYHGGADDNKNRFYTLDQCMDACVLTEEDMRDTRTLNSFNPDDCLLEKDEGFGRARQRRFYYNSTLNRCMEFIFAGDGGNINRFNEKHECMDACFREMKRLDCRLHVQMVDTCRLTANEHRIARCTTLPFNASRKACAAAGCCWHHSLRICHQYATRTVRGTFCRILVESPASFIGLASFQIPTKTRRGWVGHLMFTKPNTGSFCVLKDHFTPKITVGARFLEDRGVLLEERGKIPGGYRTDFLFTGTYGPVSINPSNCVSQISRSETLD